MPTQRPEEKDSAEEDPTLSTGLIVDYVEESISLKQQ